VKFIPSHVPFSLKSNSGNCIKIRRFLTKLQTKITWILFIARGVVHCSWVQFSCGDVNRPWLSSVTGLVASRYSDNVGGAEVNRFNSEHRVITAVSRAVCMACRRLSHVRASLTLSPSLHAPSLSFSVGPMKITSRLLKNFVVPGIQP